MKASDIKNTDDLIPAIYFYCDNMHKMGVGIAHAYAEEIKKRAKQLGLTQRTLETVAQIYMTKGAHEAKYGFDDSHKV